MYSTMMMYQGGGYGYGGMHGGYGYGYSPYGMGVAAGVCFCKMNLIVLEAVP